MKLRTLSIFGTALIVSLTACGGDDAAEGDAAATDTSTAVETVAPVTPPATAPLDTGAVVPGATTPADSAPVGTDTAADTTAKM